MEASPAYIQDGGPNRAPAKHFHKADGGLHPAITPTD